MNVFGLAIENREAICFQLLCDIWSCLSYSIFFKWTWFTHSNECGGGASYAKQFQAQTTLPSLKRPRPVNCFKATHSELMIPCSSYIRFSAVAPVHYGAKSLPNPPNPNVTPLLLTAAQALTSRDMILGLHAPPVNLTNSDNTWYHAPTGPRPVSHHQEKREKWSYLHDSLVKDETAYPKQPENTWHQTQALEFGLNQSLVQLSVLKTNKKNIN